MVCDVVIANHGTLKKVIVMSPTAEFARSVKVATPPTAPTLVVPSSVPSPALRAAVTFHMSLFLRLPNCSSIRITGCCAKGTPTTTVAEGCVAIVSLLPSPTTSVRFPKLEPPEPSALVVIPLMMAVPPPVLGR